ncbi:UTP:RNA uridylyltransferase 1 [Porphyridium purpureum]|uniref:UTP:RNA uridylyltransferase 1 n=1 Tax=Porphyridium purpureum TaxID=35688 RepID=A0A5J4YWA3_PORPP|nr:UTP:RNA uridylyltransferase 1 [Porphyridium purpureum]|eukprot:POR6564..scf227_4
MAGDEWSAAGAAGGAPSASPAAAARAPNGQNGQNAQNIISPLQQMFDARMMPPPPQQHHHPHHHYLQQHQFPQQQEPPRARSGWDVPQSGESARDQHSVSATAHSPWGPPVPMDPAGAYWGAARSSPWQDGAGNAAPRVPDHQAQAWAPKSDAVHNGVSETWAPQRPPLSQAGQVAPGFDGIELMRLAAEYEQQQQLGQQRLRPYHGPHQAPSHSPAAGPSYHRPPVTSALSVAEVENMIAQARQLQLDSQPERGDGGAARKMIPNPNEIARNTEQAGAASANSVNDRTADVEDSIEYVLPARAQPRRAYPGGAVYVQRDRPESTLVHDFVRALQISLRNVIHDIMPPEADEKRKARLVRHLNKICRSEWSHSEIVMFGSSGNMLCLRGGDVDTVLIVPAQDTIYTPKPHGDEEQPTPRPMTNKQIIRRMGRCLRRARMQDVQELLRARVPIIKMFDPVSEFRVDLCVNNILGCHNTNLLRTYMQMDERVRQLALLIKYWAKRRALNEPYRGTLSSYAYVLLVIFYFQHVLRLLPSLQMLDRNGKPCRSESDVPRRIRDGWNVYFYGDGMEIPPRILAGRSAVNASLTMAQIVMGFFEFYAYVFDFSNQVVSIRLGRPIPSHEHTWNKQPCGPGDEFEQAAEPSDHALRDHNLKSAETSEDAPKRTDRLSKHYFQIEDPFDLSHDLGRVIDDVQLGVIREEFTRAFETLVATADFAHVCEAFEEPLMPVQRAHVVQGIREEPAPDWPELEKSTDHDERSATASMGGAREVTSLEDDGSRQGGP